ncbi:fatty-acid amide hydrolase 2 [Parasteatoda tepidariorum]|uniref:fatty-acid amide hydrolase 2 n=1 Tax=Parasteatoda tepidariorum TaxID=114398 RepID=UPI001C71E47F|nr:fatty-acid amide hydrolase 2 [Parasteatoda tepidariorum]
MSVNIVNIDSYYLFIMSYYIAKFMKYVRSPKKLFISVAMFFYRWFTGYFMDKVFNFTYGFGRKSSTLPPVKNPLLLDSAINLATKIRTRQVSCVNVVRAYIQRMDEVNPLINSIVDDRNTEALQEASLIDDLVFSGEKTMEELETEMPLLGVPLSVKEAICVKGMLFTTGVVRRRGIRAKEDADVITLLRKAGAIPIVVTNTSEQCFWMETYNNLYGRTNNPYDLKKTAGGSSGGEAALLASAGSVIGVGNDIGGSIRMPSFFCGVFGHKPSRGIIPNRGHFPPTEQVLQQYIGTGPMCRYATDLKVMLQVMAGANAPLLQLDKKVTLKSLKIYYMEDNGDGSFSLPVKQAVKNALQKVISHFRKICDVPPQKVNIRGLKHGFKVWAHAVSAGVVDVATVESRVFGEDCNSSVWKEFIFSLFGWSDYSFPILATVLVEKYLGPKEKSVAEPFIRIQRRMETDFQRLLQDDCIFIMPTMPEPAAHHYANTFRAQNCGYVAVFNILGLPATNCPVELDEKGMPVGVQVISGLRNDYLNLAIAREIEREFGGWTCPGPII